MFNYEEKWMNNQDYSKRWLLLGFCVWISMGNYYNYDIPTSLHNSFRDYFSSVFDENQFEIYYGFLLSISSFMNIFTPFLSGEIRDMFGNRIAILSLLTVVSIGQFLFVYGLTHMNLQLIVFGRILISIGIEPCGAVQTSLLSKYFKVDHISFATGLCEFCAGIGTITVMYLAPRIATNYGLIIAVQSGTIANAISVLCCLITLVFDFHADFTQNSYSNNHQVAIEGEEEPEDQQPPYHPKLFWMLIGYNALLWGALLTFSNFSIPILSERWHAGEVDAEEQAGTSMAIMWALTSILTPLVGLIVDKYRHRSIINIFSSILATTGLLLVWYKFPTMAINLIGISYSMASASAWSSIVYLVDYKKLGIAYAQLISMSNLCLTILPLVISVLKIKHNSYKFSLYLLAAITFITFIVAILLYFEDKKQHNALDGQKLEKENYEALQQQDNNN